jgi:hypothetical protein
MKRRLLLAIAALLLFAACTSDTVDCQYQGSSNTVVLYAYTDANGNDVQGMLTTDDNGNASVTVPKSVGCGSIDTREVPMFEMQMM